MKKLVTVLLVLCMVFSVLPVFADVVNAEEVLLIVKSKIDVPEDLTEFEYAQSTYNNSVFLGFMWYNEDYSKELTVSCNAQGRIVEYNYYEETDYSASRSLIGYNLSDAQVLAENFVKKALPEFYEKETDVLCLDENSTASSYSGRYKSFAFTFKRKCMGENVESNYVTVRVRATKEKIYVQSMSAQLDAFDELAKAEKSLSQAKDIGAVEYTEKFPVRLYYATDYYGEEEKVSLFYSIDKGFVSSVNGEAVTQTGFDNFMYAGSDSATESAMGSSNKNALTEAEVKELEEMDSLVPISAVEAKLRGIEAFRITEDMKIVSTSTNKYDEGYTVRFVLEGEKQRTSVTYNGETGEVTRLYSYKINSSQTSQAEKKTSDSASQVPEEQIKAVAEELAGDKITETTPEFNNNDKTAALNCERVVNGVPYPENSINVTYSIEEGYVTSYYLYWDKDVSEFPNPEEAVGLEKAQEIIFAIAPLYNTLVKTENGYVPAISISKNVTINAITGEDLYATGEEKVKYTDIEGHWAENMINALWEHDIYLPGENFSPDTAINLADVLRLFLACRSSGAAPAYWTKDYVVTYCINNSYIAEGEPDKIVTRKEAFDIMVNILGYGDIASYDIYKSSYTVIDGCGSAEILKAMGILIGDTARPDDNLTRAEAAVMVYRYLSE